MSPVQRLKPGVRGGSRHLATGRWICSRLSYGTRVWAAAAAPKVSQRSKGQMISQSRNPRRSRTACAPPAASFAAACLPPAAAAPPALPPPRKLPPPPPAAPPAPLQQDTVAVCSNERMSFQPLEPATTTVAGCRLQAAQADPRPYPAPPTRTSSSTHLMRSPHCRPAHPVPPHSLSSSRA